ncbi:MAG: M23 family metallopeptidase [Longimicrobiales bacterium]
MDDRNLSVIVVPHGDLETRSFSVSYRKLKVLTITGGLLGLLICFVVASWFPVMLLAARVPGLKKQLIELEGERAKVAELARDLAEVEAQYDNIRKLLGADAPAAGSPPMLPPLRDSTKTDGTAPISTAPDLRRWPLNQRGFVTQNAGVGARGHPGIDIAVKNDSDVRAAGSGTIKSAGLDDVYGKYIVIDHGQGYMSVYGHANRLLVQPGDRVAAGDKIALSGSTGRSTAPHLHFEIRKDGAVMDPFSYVRQPK